MPYAVLSAGVVYPPHPYDNSAKKPSEYEPPLVFVQQRHGQQVCITEPEHDEHCRLYLHDALLLGVTLDEGPSIFW